MESKSFDWGVKWTWNNKTDLFKRFYYFFQISVATFHIGRLELAQQSIGSTVCIKVQAASLSGEECPAISWEEFQVLFIKCFGFFCNFLVFFKVGKSGLINQLVSLLFLYECSIQYWLYRNQRPWKLGGQLSELLNIYFKNIKLIC